MPAASSTRLAGEHLHGFLRSLDEAGMAVSAPKKADFLLSVVASPPGDVEALYWRARVTMVSSATDFSAFDSLFDAWFRGGRLLIEERSDAPADEEGNSAAPPSGEGGRLDALDVRAGSGLHASPLDLTRRSSFPPTSEADRERLREVGSKLESALPEIAGRRCRRTSSGPWLHLEEVLRAATRTGGEIVELAWLRRPARTRRVLLLIDVSGSLREHSPDLLRFAHRVVRVAERAEAFTFGTRLTRVTRALDTRDVDSALAALSETVLDADGGTRIGVALEQFLANPRYLALARGALIIVLSDGLERGEPSLMARATERLSRLGHRLVWWSPLACDPAYRPVTRGMQAVMGNIDRLAGARDLSSLLAEVGRLPETSARPRRMAARGWATECPPAQAIGS